MDYDGLKCIENYYTHIQLQRCESEEKHWLSSFDSQNVMKELGIRLDKIAHTNIALGDEVGDRGFYKSIRDNAVANSSTKECTDPGDRNTPMNTTDSDSENREIMH